MMESGERASEPNQTPPVHAAKGKLQMQSHTSPFKQAQAGHCLKAANSLT